MRRPPSRSSSATTAALMPAQRATCSSIGWSARGASPRKAYLATSPRPQAHSRGGSDDERLGVAQHRLGLPEGADEVLALGQVDAGLAADGGVDLRQQRGGDVHVRRAAVVGGGREAGDVGDDAAAHGDDDVGPREARRGEAAGQILDGGERLGVLAVGDDADLGGHAGIEALDPPGVGDGLLGDDGGGLGARRDEAPQLVARAGADEDGVAALGEVDGEGAHGRAQSRPAGAAPRAARCARPPLRA